MSSRWPPENQTAPVAGRGGGDRHSGSSIRDNLLKPTLPVAQGDNCIAARAKLAKATERLNAVTDDLACMADWRDDLAARLWRAQVCFEYVALDADELDHLAEEVHAFHAVCFALADNVKAANRTPASDLDERERTAA